MSIEDERYWVKYHDCGIFYVIDSNTSKMVFEGTRDECDNYIEQKNKTPNQ